MTKFLPIIKTFGSKVAMIAYLNLQNIETIEYVPQKRLTISMVSGMCHNWTQAEADTVYKNICIRLDFNYDWADHEEDEDPEQPNHGRMRPPVGA